MTTNALLPRERLRPLLLTLSETATTLREVAAHPAVKREWHEF